MRALGRFFLFHGLLLFIVDEEVSDWECTALPDRYDTTGKIKVSIEGEEASEEGAWMEETYVHSESGDAGIVSRCTDRSFLLFKLHLLTEVLFILARGHSNRLTREGAVPALNHTLFFLTCAEVNT